jgi:hypothetical protein
MWELMKDLHDGLEFDAFVLMLMGSATAPLASLLGRPLGLPVGAIVITDEDQDSCRRLDVSNLRHDNSTIKTKSSTWNGR